jgi:transcriptional regulator with XRE-family HTH domain
MPTLVCRRTQRWIVYYGMSSPLAKRIGDRIRELREAKGFSQDELAHRAGCHRTYVGMVERAEKSISVAGLSKFAKALGTTMSSLLEGL